VELLAVAAIGEPESRLGRRQPLDLVDLVLEVAGPTRDGPGPVAHLLELRAAVALAQAVPGRRQRQPETHPQPRLLQRLPGCRHGPLLAPLELALGPGP